MHDVGASLPIVGGGPADDWPCPIVLDDLFVFWGERSSWNGRLCLSVLELRKTYVKADVSYCHM